VIQAPPRGGSVRHDPQRNPRFMSAWSLSLRTSAKRFAVEVQPTGKKEVDERRWAPFVARILGRASGTSHVLSYSIRATAIDEDAAHWTRCSVKKSHANFETSWRRTNSDRRECFANSSALAF
jgi:hypothetical protein